MLELDRLSLVAGVEEVVLDATMSVHEGERVGLIGPSGAGKTLIAQAVVGLVPRPGVSISGGTIRFEGRDLLSMPAAERRAILGAMIGYIPQQPLLALNPVLSIAHQAELVLQRHTRWSRDERQSRLHEILRALAFDDPARISRARPQELSGGERQRALLAICLALRPRLVVADEPTSSLDKVMQASLVRLLDQLRREQGFALLLIGHDAGVMRRLVDRVYRLNNRRLETAVLPAAPTIYPPAPVERQGDQEVLSAVALEKRFAKRLVLQDTHLKLWRGECLGVVGRSGAGKTTLARCLSGLTRPSSGSILLRSKDGVPREVTGCNQRIQMIFQDPAASFDPLLTLRQSLEEALHLRGVPRREYQGRLHSLCALVSLDISVLNRSPAAVSGGECQRAAIARALVMEPAVLIADEATSALDAMAESHILDLFAKLTRSSGMAIIFNSHNLGALARICERLVVMSEGRICEDRPTRDIVAAPRSWVARELVEAAVSLA